jgi:hypothetical protein
VTGAASEARTPRATANQHPAGRAARRLRAGPLRKSAPAQPRAVAKKVAPRRREVGTPARLAAKKAAIVPPRAVAKAEPLAGKARGGRDPGGARETAAAPSHGNTPPAAVG